MHKWGDARKTIRAELQRRKMTPTAAADLMDGVSHQCIRNILSGRTEPWEVKVNTAQEICRVFRRRVMIRDFYRPAGAE